VEVSIVIRTYNEQRHLPELLAAISHQEVDFEFETVIVDSGSTDNTLDIAKKFGCRISHIPKTEFTFGRSLNVGCEKARDRTSVHQWSLRSLRYQLVGEADRPSS
jgi:glycosyltransferase involved in cell wall biosynthesis